jgi:hypothetical protein
VDHQSVEFGFWLGIAVLALVWSHIQIWHTRRALGRVQQNPSVQQVRSISSAAAEPSSAVIAQ